MAGRSGSTFQKRQKEMERAEKQREKFAKRLAKKDEDGTEKSETFEELVVLDGPLPQDF